MNEWMNEWMFNDVNRSAIGCQNKNLNENEWMNECLTM